MNLNEAKEILKENGYLLEDRFGNGKDRYGHRINRLKLSDIDEPITVDFINSDNYKNYIGKTVNVIGNVYLLNKKLTKLPIQFGTVGGSFECFYNHLTTLEGAPKEVGGDFICSSNDLTSLEGAPEKVGGDFNCRKNKVKFTEDDVLAVSDVKGEIKV